MYFKRKFLKQWLMKEWMMSNKQKEAPMFTLTFICIMIKWNTCYQS